jgi:hypothetical protein
LQSSTARNPINCSFEIPDPSWSQRFPEQTLVRKFSYGALFSAYLLASYYEGITIALYFRTLTAGDPHNILVGPAPFTFPHLYGKCQFMDAEGEVSCGT